MSQEQQTLTILAALNCEAKPWVDFYRLKKVCDKPFIVYQNPAGAVQVVISGIGSVSMATAVGWIAGFSTVKQRAWLNIGIAGHSDYELGTLSRVHSFIDAYDLRRYYPPMTARWKGESEALLSVNAPSESYPEDALVDMEGLSFYRSATAFSSAELVQSVKVVSDNTEHSCANLNAAKITELMQPHVKQIVQFASDMLEIMNVSQTDANSPLLALKGTHSQMQQLEALLSKIAALDLQLEADQVASEINNIDHALSKLGAIVDSAVPTLGVS